MTAIADDFPFHHGRLALSFAGTVANRASQPRERLPDAASLGRWLHIAGLTAGERAVPVSARDYTRAIELREVIARIASALAGGRPAPVPDVARLNEAVRRSHAAPQLRRARGALRIAPPEDARRAIGRIAADAVDLFGGEEAAQLHRCDLDSCGAIFVDAGGRRPRRWCSAERCGNVARVRAHRAQ